MVTWVTMVAWVARIARIARIARVDWLCRGGRQLGQSFSRTAGLVSVSGLLTLATIGMFMASPITQANPEERGAELARAVEAAERGFGDFTVSGRMFLRDADGRENERSFTLRALETGDSGTRNLFVFDGPPDIRGVALLTVDPVSSELQQWLYLPSMQRTRRISTSHRGSAFAGSELAYEDFISEVAERSRHRWLREEPCPTQTTLICQVIERVPETLSSAYGHQQLWIDTAEYRIHQIDYHDRHGSPLKTLTLDEYHLHDSRFWRPLRLRMTHQHTGRETEILWSEYRFATGLTVNDFTLRALERLR